MGANIFRKKSVDRMNSPEELNDYIKICSPSMWLILSAVLLLLIGALIWGSVSALYTVLETSAVAEDGRLKIYIKADYIDQVLNKQFTIEDEDEVFYLDEDMFDSDAIMVDDSIPDYACYLGELTEGEWIFIAETETDLRNGVYEVDIELESVMPISFITN